MNNTNANAINAVNRIITKTKKKASVAFSAQAEKHYRELFLDTMHDSLLDDINHSISKYLVWTHKNYSNPPKLSNLIKLDRQ